jgi:hypothetical protein
MLLLRINQLQLMRFTLGIQIMFGFGGEKAWLPQIMESAVKRSKTQETRIRTGVWDFFVRATREGSEPMCVRA